jgi:uncharacterized membrane protein YfcA
VIAFIEGVGTATTLGVLAVILFAAFIHGIAGFAFGLMSVPLLALLLPAHQAVVISSLVGASSNVWQAWVHRDHVDRAAVRDLTVSAYLGMPVGLVVFKLVSSRTLQVLLGVAVVAAVVVLVSRVDVSRVGRRFEYGCGFVSGVLNTSLSTNGPPVVFALQARGLPPDLFRGTISLFFTICNVGALVGFALAGKVNRAGVLVSLVALPALLVGLAGAGPVRRRIDPRRFRALVLVLLVVSAASAILAAL